MAILKLKPHTTDYLWGGEKLKEQYNIRSNKTPLAEAWMLSAHKSGESVIDNTDDKGLTFSEYISKYGKTVLGKNCDKFDDFPVLIKFIDAKDNLSIQVHPSDEFALKHEGEFGKTEMWYILEAEPDAFLYYGFKEEISKDEFVERIENNTLLEVLNAVKAKKGDVFFIPAGTLHAIGKGIVIAEVQQNSNLTYRVYDYARVDKNGNTRELHVEKAVKVTDLTPPKQLDFGNHLAKCDYFIVDVIEDDYSDICDENSFVSILVLDGKGKLNCKDECLSIKKGDSLFLPANSGEFKLSNVKALITRV